MLYVLTIFAYLLGSISSAILAAKFFSLIDPREVGSGNPGATNILRQGNKKAAALTLVGDILKGLIPVLIARSLTDDALTICLVGGAAFLGHLFPLYFGFKGGKGVATGLGVYLAIDWLLGLSLIGTWLLIAALFRYSSLAATITSLASPFLVYFFLNDYPYLILSIVMAALLLWRHKDNLNRLIQGKEDKIKLGKN